MSRAAEFEAELEKLRASGMGGGGIGGAEERKASAEELREEDRDSDYIFNDRIYLLSYDFVIGPDGLVRIFEVQNAFGTVFSKTGTISSKRERATFDEIAARLGISPTCEYGDFRPTKTFQRDVWNSYCPSFIPRNTKLLPQTKPKETVSKIYQFLQDNPDLETIVLKCNHTSASEGVTFISRDYLMTKLSNLQKMGYSIDDVLDGDITAIDAINFMKNLRINNISLSAYDEISLEEFVEIAPNPETKFRETMRAVVAFDPDKKISNAFHVVTYGHENDKPSASFFHGGRGYRLDCLSETAPFYGYGVEEEVLLAASRNFPYVCFDELQDQFTKLSAAICSPLKISKHFRKMDEILGQRRNFSSAKDYAKLMKDLFFIDPRNENQNKYQAKITDLSCEFEIFVRDMDRVSNKEARQISKSIFTRMLKTAHEHGLLDHILNKIDTTSGTPPTITSAGGRKFHKLKKLLHLLLLEQESGIILPEEEFAKLDAETDGFVEENIDHDQVKAMIAAPKINYTKRLVPEGIVKQFQLEQLKAQGKSSCAVM